MTATTILSLISGLFTIIRFFVDYAERQQWIDKGAAEVVLKSLQESDDAIARAKQARDAARGRNTSDPDSILRDDDGFKRPDN